MKPVVLARKHWVRMKIDPSHRRQKKSGGRIPTAALDPAGAGILRGFVFNRAPVRLCLWRRDGLA
jgi:hypothetical protein